MLNEHAENFSISISENSAVVGNLKEKQRMLKTLSRSGERDAKLMHQTGNPSWEFQGVDKYFSRLTKFLVCSNFI